MKKDTLDIQGFDHDYSMNYLSNQLQGLTNLSDSENICAVLRCSIMHETLPPVTARHFMYNPVGYSKTDNDQAVSIILENE
jgi:hypothetical protein